MHPIRACRCHAHTQHLSPTPPFVFTRDPRAQISYRVDRAVDQDGVHRTSLDQAGTSVALRQASTPANTEDYGFGQEVVLPKRRELAFFCILVVVIFFASAQNANRRLQDGTLFSETTQIATVFTIAGPDDETTDFTMIVDVAPNGEAVARLGIEDILLLNDEDTGLCDECTLTFVAGECLSGDCDSYDMEATNNNMDVRSTVSTPTIAAC